MKRIKSSRRDFIKGSSFIASTAVGTSLYIGSNPELEAAPATSSSQRTTALAQCPYCGVGCGTGVGVGAGVGLWQFLVHSCRLMVELEFLMHVAMLPTFWQAYLVWFFLHSTGSHSFLHKRSPAVGSQELHWAVIWSHFLPESHV